MTKKNEKSFLAIDGFDDINNDKSSEQMLVESLNINHKSKDKRQTKGAAAGCKPGTTRKTYVLPLELIDKLKAIAAHTRKKEVAVVIEMLEKGVIDIENKFGNEITSLTKFDINN